MHKPRYRISLIITITYLIALLLIVFWPTLVDKPISGTLTEAIRWLHGIGMPKFIGYNKIEFAANILLFIPMGYIAATWLRKPWMALLLGFLVSGVVELGQSLWLPARFSSVLDIVANTLGAGVGIAILLVERKVRIRHPVTGVDNPGKHDGPARVSPGAGAESSRRQAREHELEMAGSSRARVAEASRDKAVDSSGAGQNFLSRTLQTRTGLVLSLLLAAGLGAVAQATFTSVASKATTTQQAPKQSESAQTTPAAPPSAVPSPTPTPPATPAAPTPAPKPIAAFIGDDFAVGVGATHRGAGWASVLSGLKGWDTRNLGNKSTGYVSHLSGEPALAACDRESCPAYGDLVEQVRSMQPAIVVVSGGRNDAWQVPADTAAAVDKFYRRLKEAAPHARIVAVAPTWDGTKIPASFSQLSQQVKTSALAIGADFIDIGQPLQGRPDRLVGSGMYPNDAGHKALAQSVASALNAKTSKVPPSSTKPSSAPPSTATPSAKP